MLRLPARVVGSNHSYPWCMRFAALFAVLVLVLAGCSADDWREITGENGTAATPRTDVDLEQSDEAPPHSSLSNIIEEALPSVVNVKVTSASGGLLGGGEGSGVVIDESGVILTNYHVVQCAVRVRVVFTDDREPVEGTIIGAVPERDLAVVQADADGLEAVPIGSSEDLRLGDDVIAIGFPLGLGGPTVTRGILSGEDRNIEAQTADGEVESLEGLLQTDAAINPGNSGGALIDRAGRLIGINTAVAGAAENIGFAIAIDRALPVIEEILDEPAARQAWLGVSLGSVATDFEALDLDLPADTRGALVAAVFGGSPADEAGLPEGSVVLSANGTAIENAEDLMGILSDLSPGDEVDLTVLTPTGRRAVSARLTQRPLPVDLQERC